MLKVEGISKTFGTGEEAARALRDINLRVERGEMVAVTGPSGCGKTTLLHVIAGLELADSGSIWLGDAALHELGEQQLARIRLQRMGFIFQSYHLVPVLSAVENVMLPLMAKGMRRKEAEGAARETLELVGLEHKAGSLPAELSGGQNQRVAIARAVAGRPDILFADEPTGALDSGNAEQILGLLELLNSRYGTTVILVTHDLEYAGRMNRMIRMFNGRIVHDDRGAA